MTNLKKKCILLSIVRIYNKIIKIVIIIFQLNLYLIRVKKKLKITRKVLRGKNNHLKIQII